MCYQPLVLILCHIMPSLMMKIMTTTTNNDDNNNNGSDDNNNNDNCDFSEPWPEGARKQPRTTRLRVSKQQVEYL